MTSPQVSAGRRGTMWAYLVVSSEQQAETLQFQRSWAREIATQYAWTITETFEGVSSGRDGTRKLLTRLVDQLERTPRADRPERVLMIRLDRLGRGLGIEALAAMAQITQLGVTIHTRQDGDYKIARASDSLLPLMRIVTGGIENEARRDKANEVYRRRRNNGSVLSNKRPYGLRVVDGKDHADEPSAGAVRLAFELFANGFGYAAIGSRLQATASPKVYRSGRVHETNWTNQRVRQMLRNEAYRGTIVEPTRFDRVRILMGSAPDTRNRSNPWPLSGALQCTCGRKLIGSVRGSPARRVYRCTAKAVHNRHLTFPALKIEEEFALLLSSLSAKPESLQAYALQRSAISATDRATLLARKEAATASLADLETERHRIWDLNTRGLLPDVDLKRRLADLRDRVDRATCSIEEIEIQLRRFDDDDEIVSEAAAAIDAATRIWQDASATDKAAVARSFSKIVGGLSVGMDCSLNIGPLSSTTMFFSLNGKF